MESFKLKVQILLSLAILISSLGVSAQSYDKVIDAFKTSYSLEKSGDYKQAADAMKKVYSDNSYEINLRLGWLDYNAGLFEESAAYYQKALNLQPYSEEAKFGIIYPKAAQGKWTEVIGMYKKILDVNMQNTTANYRLGLIYYGQKDYTTASKFFKKVTGLYPFDYDSLLMLAWTNYFLGKKREAKILFEKVLMNVPGDKSATEGLVLVQ